MKVTVVIYDDPYDIDQQKEILGVAVNRSLAEMLAQDKCNQICYKKEDMEYKEFEVVEKP
jgi:hypothetical protein